jgi:hypothetical protein
MYTPAPIVIAAVSKNHPFISLEKNIIVSFTEINMIMLKIKGVKIILVIRDNFILSTLQ